ncbi:acetyl-CoA C-acetyltransferase [Vagococcus lutrae]|uniref:acetyl-CoA C-acetyltransferase n=1 Tax=Vagococcus lutrae TaxID=81947 RepID=UPI00200FBF19|nr:acetyl-CoA C-acetyltransferase [Vagococcus lutrae]MDT2806551.1 acetyl-CoA C-acetyltransferase [Vagococcus lutrae]MDT2825036.1 acetyl-CoA C-acetyltransferase [Vagococcus lutrae]UQF18149.1 acetyl-CoA C-acetyltransferase [Vagococcus lutrae]
MKVYIVGAKRTPIGSFMGSLKNKSASELGSVAIQAALESAKVTAHQVDEVIMGHVLSAGQGQGPARQASLGAGLPDSVVAHSVNMVCGSGMKAMINGYAQIQAGLAKVIVAGGMESMSQAPYLLPKETRSGLKMGEHSLIDSLIVDGLTDSHYHYHMGLTAEQLAEEFVISREEQDNYAFDSQQKAIAAVDDKAFVREIAPVRVSVRGKEESFSEDEYPNRKTSLEKLARLRPAFKNDGNVTAGNASGINDGASAVVLASDGVVEQEQLTPLVEIIGIGQSGVNPLRMGLGPVKAIESALAMAKLSLSDIDYLEINEAFSSQSIAVLRELSAQHAVSEESLLEKTNIKGGAIALGHPIGASGSRILVTLIHILREKNAKYGVASLCIGGGMGIAMVVKNTEFSD